MHEEINLELENDQQISCVSHNSLLNCLFVITSENKLILYDCNSKTRIKCFDWNKTLEKSNYEYVKIYNIQDKCIVATDFTICSRLAHDGYFLLDTVFQTSFKHNLVVMPNMKTLELNAFEAKGLLNALKQIESENVNGIDEIINQLKQQITFDSSSSNSSSLSFNSTDQWTTVRITDTYSNLLTILTQSLDEIKRINMQSVAIQTMSVLLDRLYRLDYTLVETQLNNTIGVPFSNFDKRYMCSEATRRATYNQWPHMDYKWVLPDALAQAGFFHQPTHPGDDRTICFACDLCLVAWEQQDQPWSEHERHSPACQFVRGEVTENVPLSVTASNQCAHKIFKLDDFSDKVTCTSEISSERYFAVSNSTGHIVVYDCKDILKEMMHVQLLNESQYNKEYPIKIHSLCFYYRNHKHVLYGSFTIQNEVFIFSFNIFDIYRSYHSKSNKKSSKSHKNTTTTATTTTSTTSTLQAVKNSNTKTATIPNNTNNTIIPSINLNNPTNIASKISAELNKNIINGSGEFTTYINDIVKASIEEASKLTTTTPNQASNVSIAEPPSSSSAASMTNVDSSSSSTNTPLALNTVATDLTLTKTEKILNKLEAISQNNSKSITTTTNIPMKITNSVQQQSSNPFKPINSSNLSNFLVVRFETCVNQESSSSKAKSKYKKCIKILSVSSKPLSYFDTTSSSASNTNAANALQDIQLKTFEFTEKCLSFRLACLDLNQEIKSNFDIKIINLYEKYLCAVVNYETEKQISYSKLFKIKHEESSSTATNGNQQTDNTIINSTKTTTTTTITTTTTTTVTNQDSTNSVVPATNTGTVAVQNCLLATSSSRLNLTEFVLNCFTTTNSNTRIISILPITVTTFDDEDDLHYIALLNNSGVISIIDPIKNYIVIEFPSISNEEKFVHITYCYGIDKICAYTQQNKMHFISMRIYPIINQSILDESSDTIKLSEISLSKNLLVDAPLESTNLSTLHELIFLEATKTNFTAKLPSVWSPILSDQNHQRKHPQHIHSETVNLTKSWRYSNKNNSSNSDNMTDNFTVEIFLNKPIQVGCIQLKLKFNKELVTPLEIRLYKQKKSFESGKNSKNLEAKNDFNSSDKYELLFGPVDVREFLDVSLSKTYIITISSDKILETRSNLLFLNFKFSDETQVAASTSANLSASSNHQNYIQKIHITLKKYKRTGLANETLERGLMLVRRTFFINLLEMMLKTNVSENSLIKILDILNWIFYNHFSIGSKVLSELMQIFEQYLEKFLVIFYLRGNRTVSKKATMLINFLLNKNVDSDKTFASILFDNLIQLFKFIPVFESSASLHWYFMLIHQVMNLNSKKTFDVCMDMLTKLSKGHKYNYLYALLKMRYNLSCLLFENSLFDADLYLKFDITHQKLIQNQQTSGGLAGGFSNPYSFSFGSVGIAINNNMNKNNLSNQMGSSNTNSNQQQQQQNNNNLKNGNTFNNNSMGGTGIGGGGMFNTNLLNNSLKDLNLLPQSMGLIEVLPLKFKYLSSSNGTTIEKTNVNNANNNNGNSKQETPFYVLPDYFTFLDSNKPTTPTEDNKSQSESPVTEQGSQIFENENSNQTVDLSIFNSIFTFHPLQCLIVERMEPVSRHFVVIDFHFPVAITDIIIPPCSELSSLSIDYWLVKEQKDSKRLCVSTQISQSPILLNDLQPPIICRYIKLIYVSQSTNTAKAKIPIGYFFGHPYIFYDDFLPINETNQNLALPNIFRTPSLWSSYISYLEKLLEENQCHYLMSIAKLREFLNEIQFPSDNIGHLKMMQFNFNENSEFSNKIKNTYKECLDYQYKLNLNAKLLKRLKKLDNNNNDDANDFIRKNANIKVESLIAQMSQDKLRVTCGLLIKSLLCLTFQMTSNNSKTIENISNNSSNKIDLEKACILFRDLCVYGNYENECSLLLLRCCYNEPWWGQFVSNCLKKFFVSQVKEVIPMSKAFITLNEICLKSLMGSQTNNLFECLFKLVNDILSPILDTKDGCVEVTSLEWILLFISRLLMTINNNNNNNNNNDYRDQITCRWEFLENTCNNNGGKFNLNQANKPMLIRNKTKIKKKIFQTNKYFNWNKMKDSRRTIDKNMRKNFSKSENSFLNYNNQNSNTSDKYSKLSLLNNAKNKIHLPRDVSLRAGRSLAKLLLSANSFFSSDLFVLSCRIISSLCCSIQPAISFSEIINKNDLNQLILLNISAEFNHGSVSWGSPWSQHALLCLFMDIIENDKITNDFNEISKTSFDQLQQQQQQQQQQQNNNKTFKFESEQTNNLKIIEENEELQSSTTSSNDKNNTYNLLQHLSDDLKSNILNEFTKMNIQPNESGSAAAAAEQNKTDDSKSTVQNSLQNLNKYLHMNIHQLQSHLSKFPFFDINNHQLLIHNAQKGIKKNPISSYYPLINNKTNKSIMMMHNSMDQFQSNLAISYDNRLDNSIFQTIETNLFINICIQNDSINRSVLEPLPAIVFPIISTNFNFDEISSESAATKLLNKTSSISLIQETLEFIFRDLTTINIENLLTFWLTLAMLDSEIKYDLNQDSLFYLNVKTANYLLDYLLNYSYMNVKLWHLSFRMLSVVICGGSKSTDDSTTSIISTFVNSDSLYKFIYKFISSNEELAGDECCTSMSEFLQRLSDMIMNHDLEKHFKKKLFEILCDCIDVNGCVTRHQGPLDAQVVFAEYLISEDILICYDLEEQEVEEKELNNNIEKNNKEFEKMFIRYFDSLSKLVHYHICVYPRLSIKGVTSPRSCFSGVLTSLLFGSRTLKVNNNNNNKSLNDHHKSSNQGFNMYNSFKPASQYGFGNLAKINLNNKNQFSNKFAPPSNSNNNNMNNMNSQNSNKYSILCNRDNLVCILLKMGINLISNMRSSSEIGSGSGTKNGHNYSKAQKQVDLLEKIIFEEQQNENNNSEMIQEPDQMMSQNNDKGNNNNNNELYDDDLLLQQLFFYELQQIDDQVSNNNNNNNQSQNEELDFCFETNETQTTAAPATNKPNNNNEYDDDYYSSLDSQQEQQQQQQQQEEEEEEFLNIISNSTIKSNKLIQLISNESLELLIESLGLCQSSALAMVISNSSYPIELNLEDIQTPGDGLFLLLKYVSSTPVKLVQPSYSYLNKIKRLSEPLLWFFATLFSNEDAVNCFINTGGVEIISKGFALTTRQLLYSGPCIVSSLMNMIDSDRQNIKLINNNYDNESTEGFTNFASFGSIMCTNPSGNPVDVLLQNTATHRRIRSAIWSYHFQVHEHKVGLFLTFPHTFLLKEVHVLPHTVSFGNCPAYVSLEVSRDGSFMTPIGPPIYTTGMLSIKLQLNKSELVNTIQINLYKSKDSQMIGLSQIRILGYPIFENMLSAKPDMMLTPVEDLVSRSNMGWLRLLYMCLTSVSSLEQFVCQNIQDSTIHLCIRLLASPAMIIYDKIVETILLKLSKHDTKRGLDIIKALLHAENGLESGIYSVPHGVLIETLINILFEISEIKYDDGNNEIEKLRIDLIISWLNDCFEKKRTDKNLEDEFNLSPHRNPSNMLLHCVSCIIYKTKQDLNINEKFIESMIEYSIYLNDYYSKQSIDWILCSVFANKPQFLHVLIEMIDLKQLDESLHKDLYENDNKSSNNNKNVMSLLETLSVSIQSTQVLEIFINGDFFKNLVDLFIKILDKYYTELNQKLQLNILKIFVAIADFSLGKTWLGESGSVVWQKLVHLLCYSNYSNQLNNSEEICSAVIRLIKKMLFCNTSNQNKFSVYITKLIQEYVCANTSLTNSSGSKISGFLHQLILQVFLDDQILTVNFQRKSKIFKISCNSSMGLLTHPRFGTGYDCCCLEISLQKTAAEIINSITDVPISQMLNIDQINKNTAAAAAAEKATTANLLDMNSLLNNIKHYGESKNVNKPFESLKQPKLNSEPISSSSSNNSFPKVNLVLNLTDLNEEIILSNDMTLEKILGLYLCKTKQTYVQDLELNIQLSTIDEKMNFNLDEINKFVPSSPLDEFVKCNGLTILAERLPIFMPFIHEPLLSVTDKDRISASFDHISKTSPDFVDYVIMNESDEPFVDDIYNDMPITSNGLSQSCKLKKINMPPYAFIAFGFFLKIPGYAKIILRDRKQAQSILKLLLGANKSKDDEFGLSLSTMPFESLRELLYDAKLSSDTNIKFELNTFFTENSILTLILSILSSISHHPHKKMIPHFTRKIVPDSSSAAATSSSSFPADSSNPSIKITEEKNSNYWAKGTGFGTGSTIQQWDAEKTMMQQRMEEDHVACILEILSNFIECCNENINEKIMEIFDDSCIINALSSYLRNDSVLDISRHIPLYKSVLKLVQSLAYHTKLQTFLTKCNIYELIKNMKQFVDTYIRKIKLTEEESLFSLLNVLNATFETVEINLKPSLDAQVIPDNDDALDNLDDNSEKKYCDILKEFQFDSFSIVTENENGTLKANLPYYYEASLNEPANFNNSNRSKRLAQETVTISNSLPISYSSTVFVRCDEERLDVMKVLITGPQDTPYANGCFEFDVFFPADYPDSPPMINLQTTGNQTVRFNPNLYHDGKVCLSILNTWHGRPEERWNGQTSSFLQVLVSIQSLILVSEPYFNEPGYERSRGTPAGTASSIEHDANIRQATVRWGMLETLKKPSICFKEPIRKHFLLKRKEIRIQCEKWLKEMELHINDKQIGQSVSKSYLSLKRHMNQLFEELDKLEKNESMTNETAATTPKGES